MAKKRQQDGFGAGLPGPWIFPLALSSLTGPFPFARFGRKREIPAAPAGIPIRQPSRAGREFRHE